MPYVSQLLGARLPGSRTRVRDVLLTPGMVPVVAALLTTAGRVPWRKSFWTDGSLHLDDAVAEALGTAADDVSVSRSLLDRQVLDARGLKVVRINDVQLAPHDGRLVVTGVDVGARGYLRRLGVERIASWLADLLGYELPDAVIPWSYVASLEPSAGITLGVGRELVARLRRVEVAELLDALPGADRERVVDVTDDAILAGALADVSLRVQDEMLDQLGTVRAGRVLGLMRPDEAADVLGRLEYERAERLANAMPATEQDVVRTLLGYHSRTAGGMMTPELVSVRKDARVSAALEVLRARAPLAESVYYVYAVDDEDMLRGVVPLSALLTAPPDSRVSDVVRPDVVRVEADASDDAVAETMERYDLLAVPVVDHDERLLGIITVDDVMHTLETRAGEDLAAVTGGHESSALAAFAPGQVGALVASIAVGMAAAAVLMRAHEPRGPWLVAGLVPLVLRLAHDLGAWSLASRLEEGAEHLVRAGGVHTIAGAAAGVPVAAVLFGLGALQVGWGFGLAVAAATLAGAVTAATIGTLVPRVLEAVRRSRWMMRGRIVPLTAALGGLLAYLGAMSVLT